MLQPSSCIAGILNLHPENQCVLTTFDTVLLMCSMHYTFVIGRWAVPYPSPLNDPLNTQEYPGGINRGVHVEKTALMQTGGRA